MEALIICAVGYIILMVLLSNRSKLKQGNSLAIQNVAPVVEPSGVTGEETPNKNSPPDVLTMLKSASQCVAFKQPKVSESCSDEQGLLGGP